MQKKITVFMTALLMLESIFPVVASASSIEEPVEINGSTSESIVELPIQEDFESVEEVIGTDIDSTSEVQPEVTEEAIANESEIEVPNQLSGTIDEIMESAVSAETQQTNNLIIDLNTLTLNKNNFVGGDKIIFTAKPTINESFGAIRLYYTNGTNLVSIEMWFNSETNLYESDYHVGHGLPKGTYVLSEIVIPESYSSNVSIKPSDYYSNAEQFNLNVETLYSNSDGLEKLLESGSVTNQIVKPGDKVEVKIRTAIPVYWENVVVAFENTFRETIYVDLLLDESRRELTGSFVIPNSGDTTWKPTYFSFGEGSQGYAQSLESLFLKDMSVTLSSVPVIIAEDYPRVPASDSLDLYSLFKVLDSVDGDITNQASIEYSYLNTNESGSYVISVSATNSRGMTVEKDIFLEIDKPAITGINIDYSGKRTLNPKDMVNLKAYLDYIDMDTEPAFTPAWKTNNPSVLNVDNNGNVNAVSTGFASISVSYLNFEDTVDFYVTTEDILDMHIIDYSKTILNQKIDADIYISSGSRVVFDNISINGNVYVDGYLEIKNSQISGSIYADNLIHEYNGDYTYIPYSTVNDFGSELNVQKFSQRNDVLFELYENPVTVLDGRTLLAGRTLLSDIQYSFTQSFWRAPKIEIGDFNLTLYPEINTEKIYFGYYDRYNAPKYEANLIWKATSPDGTIHHLPNLEVKDFKVRVNSNVDFLSYATAFDIEDGDISQNIKYDSGTIDMSQAGTTYQVKYWIVDSMQGKTEKTVSVEVVDPSIDRIWTDSIVNVGETTDTYFTINGYNLDLPNIEWKVGDESIATLDFTNRTSSLSSYGYSHTQYVKINGLKRGKTTITASYLGVEYSFPIEVFESEVLDFDLPLYEIELTQGEEIYLPNPYNIKIKDFPDTSPTYSIDSDAISINIYRRLVANKLGEATLSVTVGDLTKNIQVKVIPKISYRTHVQSYGWQPFVSNDQMSGTSGQAKRLEGIEIKLENHPYEGGVEYQTHVQSYGWMDWQKDGAMSGTEGEAKRLEGIRIRLTGELAEHYDIYYRVHAQSFGWLDWAKNGESAGTEGLAKRLEGIEIRLVKKGEATPGNTDRPYIKTAASVSYTTHVQKEGWQAYVKAGQMAGTSGKALRLEGIKLQVTDPTLSGSIAYRTHVQSVGWQDWKADDEMSGTSGKGLRLEAIEIKLTGELAQYYDVYYRVHAQSYGWLGWAKNGESAGTEGLAKRLEGIEIVLVKKGGKAPGTTTGSFVKK